MKTIKLMMLMLALSGCGTKIYPIDSTLIDEDTATVIVFNSGGCCNTEFPIFLDGENVGQ
ncbi:MAG: hypothetical protein H0A75_06340 [Candidatus Methanofishera endochildressiae]|uniref:Lipoprotein n=1 Tax=Candidatus Methanofishera endochildressiae TaxID=2738884 RepID=A0A7Z0SDS8_9GAMM|nr:hypothetical protein [Candidatus Methanofishera endochildressiae]